MLTKFLIRLTRDINCKILIKLNLKMKTFVITTALAAIASNTDIKQFENYYGTLAEVEVESQAECHPCHNNYSLVNYGCNNHCCDCCCDCCDDHTSGDECTDELCP